jgi:hypothetical protein
MHMNSKKMMMMSLSRNLISMTQMIRKVKTVKVSQFTTLKNLTFLIIFTINLSQFSQNQILILRMNISNPYALLYTE